MDQFQSTFQPGYAVSEAQSALVRSVFGWMTLGLALTGVIATYVLNTPAVQPILFSNALWVLIIAELGLVFWLSARVMKMSAGKATGIFLLYSALNGVTLAPLALIYTSESIASTFFIAAGTFGTMAFYGYVTKRDLSGLRSFLFMGLIGILIAMVVNMFMQSSAMGFAISVLGVGIFTGLAAADVQKFRKMGSEVSVGTDNFRRIAIIGALTLYLDFINLFIMLLRLLGDRR